MKLNHFAAAIVRKKLHIFALVIVLLPVISRSQEYSVKDLGSLGSETSFATSVNNKGEVVGSSGVEIETEENTDDQLFPFLYSNGVMTELGVLSDSWWAYANAINDNGLIVGQSEIDAGEGPAHVHAVRWNTALHDMAPGSESYAVAINQNGIAAGVDGFIDGTPYSEEGYLVGAVPIGATFSGGHTYQIHTGLYASVNPTGINNAGQISAECMTANGVWEGCLVDGTTQKVLQPVSTYRRSQPMAINASGYTCGYSFRGKRSEPTSVIATYWKDTVPTSMGSPADTHDSECLAMDDYMSGVGSAWTTTSNISVGVIFDPLLGARNLNTLISPYQLRGHGFTIINAVSISDTGYIAANCSHQDGGVRACLLTPNAVYVVQLSVLTLADKYPHCDACRTVLAPLARLLPTSLAGLSSLERKRVLETIDEIVSDVEGLEHKREISQPHALLIVHEAQLVAAALEPKS